eukprot:CFRG0521T1
MLKESVVLYELTTSMVNDSLVVVLGATGVGKSRLAIDLAKQFNGEVISCDSMQIYRGLDRTTNKVTEDEMDGVPHHMLSLLAVDDQYTVVQYRDQALELIEQIHNRNKIPILCGGTSYYAEAILTCSLIDENTGPPIVEKNQDLNGTNIQRDYTFKALRNIDPISSARLHPNDARKIRRALEVYYETGVPYSKWLDRQKQNRSSPFRFQKTLVLWMYCDLEVLDGRLDARVDTMFRNGALKEMQDLVDSMPVSVLAPTTAQNQTAPTLKQTTISFTHGVWQNIGLKEMYPFLTSGEGYQQCVANMKRGTRRYARRQLTWLRGHFAGLMNICENVNTNNDDNSKDGRMCSNAIEDVNEILVPMEGEETLRDETMYKIQIKKANNNSVMRGCEKIMNPETIEEKYDRMLSKTISLISDHEKVPEASSSVHVNTLASASVSTSEPPSTSLSTPYSAPTPTSASTSTSSTAVSVAQVEMNVYIIDGTDTSKYTSTALPRAANLMATFLSKKTRVMPPVNPMADLPPSIRDSLCTAQARITVSTKVNQKRHCDMCDKYVLGDNAWTAHTRSKRHKALRKRARKHMDGHTHTSGDLPL